MTLHSPSQSLHFAGLASSGLTLQDVLGAYAVREIIMLPSHRFRQTVDGKLDIILVDESQMYSKRVDNCVFSVGSKWLKECP